MSERLYLFWNAISPWAIRSRRRARGNGLLVANLMHLPEHKRMRLLREQGRRHRECHPPPSPPTTRSDPT